MSEEIESHILDSYRIVSKIGSGAYGHVWKVIDANNGNTYALKKNFDAFSNSSDSQRTYRQIMFLKQLSNPYIVKLHHVIKANNDKDIYLIFQYMDVDLHSLCRNPSTLSADHHKYILYQIAKSILYLHSAQIVHRDLKPSNVLVNKNCKIKLCDFGLVRSLQENNNMGGIMTDYIATRWYRAPQLLFSCPKYSKSIDIWGYGCLMGQVVRSKPMFSGTSTQHQLELILSWTGTPTTKQISTMQPYVNRNTINMIKPKRLLNKKQYVPCNNNKFHGLLEKTLRFCPEDRPTIYQILMDPYFQQYQPSKDRQIKDILEKRQRITVPVDDNNRLTPNQYRQLIYCQIACSNKNTRQSQLSGYGLTTPSTTYTKQSKLSQIKRRRGRIGIQTVSLSNKVSRMNSLNKQKSKRKGISLCTKKNKTQTSNDANNPTKKLIYQQHPIQKCLEQAQVKKNKKAVNIHSQNYHQFLHRH